MSIPIEHVESLPRPWARQQATAAYGRGEIVRDQDRAERDTVAEDPAQPVGATVAGIGIDGEQPVPLLDVCAREQGAGLARARRGL